MAEFPWTRKEHDHFASKIEHKLFLYKIAIGVGVVIIAVGNATGLYMLSRTAQENKRSAIALCALRENYIEQNENSRAYLEDLEAGRRDPIPGITNRDIVQGIRDRDDTIRTLDLLRCPV